MVFKRSIAICISIALVRLLFGSVQDTLPKPLSGDSIFVTMEEYPLKVRHHRVTAGETLFSLSRFYGLKVKELMYFNPHLKSTILPIDEVVKIPIPNKVIVRHRDTSFRQDFHTPVYYRVQKGDNLFRIARQYFKMPVDTLVQRNRLDTTTISLNQDLHIGWMSIAGIPDSMQYNSGLLLRNFKYRRDYFVYHDSLSFQTQGPAFWQDSQLSNYEFLVLYDNSPINSIVAIYSPMSKRTAYAKVIGRVPKHLSTKIVVSKAVATYLKARDNRFFVKLGH